MVYDDQLCTSRSLAWEEKLKASGGLHHRSIAECDNTLRHVVLQIVNDCNLDLSAFRMCAVFSCVEVIVLARHCLCHVTSMQLSQKL